MKTLYLIGGPMGVGKTTVCRLLNRRLEDAVFLDGDWCWNADPFQVTEETKRMVLDNICYLLNNFLRCSAYRNVVFCWVLDRRDVLESILSRLETAAVKPVSLVCTPAALTERLTRDVEAGLRGPGSVRRSLERLAHYDGLPTVKLDVTSLTPEETAEALIRLPPRRLPEAAGSGTAFP